MAFFLKESGVNQKHFPARKYTLSGVKKVAPIYASLLFYGGNQLGIWRNKYLNKSQFSCFAFLSRNHSI